ncbi:helix-turn-helix domain-containing protein [Actinomycetes bacterium KLBMP 9759]
MAPTPSLVDLLHHPVRWRIVQSLVGRPLTTGQLAELLPDVPTTTLYRHVATLVRAGVMLVTDERRVRGTVERTYALNTAAADADNDGVDRDRLRAMFTVFMAGLAADFDRYLDRDDLDPMADGVGMRQAALWLSDAEFAELQVKLQEALAPFVEHQPEDGRVRRILSTVVIPDP